MKNDNGWTLNDSLNVKGYAVNGELVFLTPWNNVDLTGYHPIEFKKSYNEY